MNQDILTFVLLSWVSSLYISLFLISILQYRVVTLFREYWHLLIVIIFVYTASYATITSFYTLNIAFFGKIPSPVGGKSIPGILGLLLASSLIWTLTYIVSFILNDAKSKEAIKYMFRNPFMASLLILDLIFLFRIFVSTEDSVYAPSPHGDVTVVYSDLSIAMSSVIIALVSYPIFILYKRIPKNQIFKHIYTPLMIIAIMIFLQLIVGETTIILSTKLRLSLYPVMNLIYLLTSIFGVGYYYKELINAYKIYTSSVTSLEKEKYVKHIDKQPSVISGRILLKIDPEVSYYPMLKEWIDALSKDQKVILVTSPISPFARSSFENEDNIIRIFTVTVGMMSHSGNTIPITNLSLVANTIVNLAMKNRDSVIVFDNFIDIVTINGVKDVYTFLKQLAEILAENTIIVVLNWKALSEKEYALLSSLFNKIYTTSQGKIVRIKDDF